MKITLDLACPSDYIYQKVIHAVWVDIKQHSNHRPPKDALAGFSYTKQFQNGSHATIMIVEQKANASYVYETETARQRYTGAYTFTAIDDTHCQVVYEETVTSEQWLQRLNDGLNRCLFGYQRKKQFKTMLETMAKDYQLEQI